MVIFHSYVSLPEGNDMAKVGKMEKKHQEVGLQRQPSGIFEKHRWEMVGI